MNEDILNSIFYLSLVLLGLPTIYLTTSSKESSELKKQALKIYPVMLFLILGITFLIYGVENTKRAIGNAFGDVIFYLFFTIVLLLACLLILFLLLANWSMVLDEIKRYLKKNK